MRTKVYILVFILFSFCRQGWAVASEELYLTAPSAVLIDITCNGQVLFEREARTEREPASTTKIMTAILALELGQPDTPVKVSRYAAYTPGASIYLKEGETLKLSDLVKGALLNSGNDATVAIAESLAGTEEMFAWLMNRKARQIGAAQTTFKNPHGLSDFGHYSTAFDLAKMAIYAMENPLFSRLVSTREAQIPAPDGGVRYLYNTNRLLELYPGTNGIKTGTTDAAGQCLVASATRNGRQLISVVLGSSDRYGDTIALFDYGFNMYSEIAHAGKPSGQVHVINGERTSVDVIPKKTVGFTVPMEFSSYLEKRVYLPEYVKAPVNKGDKLGQVIITYMGREVSRTDLVADGDIKRLSWWSKLAPFH